MQSMYYRSHSKLRMRDIDDDTEKIRRLKGLPRNLHLPHEIRNPWMKSTFEEDFILITEFAENEGPRDVMTIPSGGAGSFDKSAFALHVMSVDFQSQNRNAEFNITGDTQLVLTDKKTGMCAFVHHFTLYDIHARGYVRPFCMSYITHSKRKVLSCLNNIIKEFQKIAKLFHMGNRVAFSTDLEQRLVELLSLNEHWHWSCRSKNKSKLEHETANKRKEVYQQTYSETKKVIEVLKPHLVDSAMLDKFRKLEDQDELQRHKLTSSESHQTECVAEERCDFAEQASPAVLFRRAHSLTSLDNLKTQDSEMPLFKTFAPAYLHNIQQLSNLHELCGWAAKEGINRLRNIVQYYSQEEIAIAIEKTEDSLIDPSTSLLTLGRSVVLNFTSNIDFKKSMNVDNSGKYSANQLFLSSLQRKLSLGSGGSCCSTDSFKSCFDDVTFDSRRSSDGMLSRFVPSASFHAELNGEEYDTFDSDTTPETPGSEFSILQFDVSSQDNLSLGSYHVLEDNCLQRQMSEMHINEHVEPRYGVLTRKSHSLENLPSMSRKNENENSSKTQEYEILKSSFGRVAKMYGEMNHGISEMKDPDVNPQKDGEGLGRETKKPLHLRKPFSKKLKIEPNSSGRSSPKRPGNHSRNEAVPLRCYAEEMCRPPDLQSSVSSILAFRNNYNFGVHLMYALLIARPVVILAKPASEREVRSLISTLWMFVSETNSCRGRVVIPWRKKALHITDLPCLRLVGLCKSRRCVIPKSVERYVSVLDYETGIIISPPYKGVFLKVVFSYRNCWPSNVTLLAFMHSIFLELACKAYVLYYSCSLGPALLETGTATETKSNMDEIEVLNRLGVHFSDAAIVQHFAEVIKQQQIDSHFHGNEELKAQTVTSDLAKRTKYRNLAPFEP